MNVSGGEKQNVAIKIYLYPHLVGVVKELETSTPTTSFAPDTTAVHRANQV